MIFIGLDIAWGTKQSSGICLFSIKGNKAILEELLILKGVDAIQYYIESKLILVEQAMICIDGPLTIPNKTGTRFAEGFINQHFRKYHAHTHAVNQKIFKKYDPDFLLVKLGAFLYQKKFNSNALNNSTSLNTLRLYEVYPHASMVSLFGLDRILPYKNKSGRTKQTRIKAFKTYRCLLENIGNTMPYVSIQPNLIPIITEKMSLKEMKSAEDKYDAIICAITGLKYWFEPSKCTFYIAQDGSHILIPKEI